MKFVVLNIIDSDYYIIMASDGETSCVDKLTYDNLKKLGKID